MTAKKYDVAVFIGRFQPFHNGHLHVIREALKIADHVSILIGSSNRARDTRNPLTFAEREVLLLESLSPDEYPRIDIQPLPDSPYNDTKWVETVQFLVGLAAEPRMRPRIAIVGHERDNSSFYLREFPQWEYVAIPEHAKIEATVLRNLWLTGGADLSNEFWQDQTTEPVREALTNFRGKPEYVDLMAEFKAEKEYKEKWGKGPHVTADAVVFQSSHVLLVERGKYPGKGRWALPGGFLNLDESLASAALRELREETKLWGEPESEVSLDMLKSSFVGCEAFGDPHRSRRGRIITHAYTYHLPKGRLPFVEGSDDAAKAFWLPLSQISADLLFEDHAFIIDRCLNFLN